MPKKTLITLLVIPADSDLPCTRKTIAKDDLSAMQEAVGGYIEPVHGPGGCEAFVNEEGLLHRLPLNARLSILMGQRLVGDGFMILDKKRNRVALDQTGIVEFARLVAELEDAPTM